LAPERDCSIQPRDWTRDPVGRSGKFSTMKIDIPSQGMLAGCEEC